MTLVRDEGPPHPPKRLGVSCQVSLSASLGKTPAQPYLKGLLESVSEKDVL